MLNRYLLLYCLSFSLFSHKLSSQDKPLTLFGETYTVPTMPKFSYVIGSDPQLPWTRQSEKKSTGNYPGEEIIWQRSIQRVNNFVSAANAENASANTLRGVIINGDLTKGGSAKQLKAFEDAMSRLDSKVKLYPGLGNHDFNNDVEENKSRMFVYLIKQTNKLGLNDSMDENSGAYSWDEGPIHFIQLNNYPSYTDVVIFGEQQKGAIKSALPWLDNDMKEAKARKQHIILNFHMWGDKFIPWMDEEFKNVIKKYKPIAIFTGHVHEDFGIVNIPPSILPDFNLPIFRSGSIFNDNYFLLDFYDDKLIVRKRMSTGGQVNNMSRPNGAEDAWKIDF